MTNNLEYLFMWLFGTHQFGEVSIQILLSFVIGLFFKKTFIEFWEYFI